MKKTFSTLMLLGLGVTAFAQEAPATSTPEATPAASVAPEQETPATAPVEESSKETKKEEKEEKVVKEQKPIEKEISKWMPEIQNRREYGKMGVVDPNQRFEGAKDTVTKFDGFAVRLGASFAMQWQGLRDEMPNKEGYKAKGPGFNTPTANINMDVQILDGMTMKVETYASSKHHNDNWVKGGYLQLDKSPIQGIKLLDEFFEYGRVKVGQYDINYGDAHFMRSDNANAAWNPFVGNMLMDAFTTEIGGEVQYFRKGFIGVLGMTSGSLGANIDGTTHQNPSILAKLGYQKQINDDLFGRLTGSIYHNSGTHQGTLYDGSRAGSRYYGMYNGSTQNAWTTNFDPDFSARVTALMINPSIIYKNFEFYGTIEHSKGANAAETFNKDGQKLGNMSEMRDAYQYALDVVYRFGDTKQYYVAGRYNIAGGDMNSGETNAAGQYVNPYEVSVRRYQIAAGWYMHKNVLLKAEYVNELYTDSPEDYQYHDANFNGYVIEAIISF